MTEPMLRRLETVLIVEDDSDLRSALSRGFRNHGLKPVAASTLAEARMALRERIDLVIADVRLPDGTGVDVCRIASESAPVPLIVAISGMATAEEAFTLAQAGALGYVAKPATFDDLWRAIQRAVSTPPAIAPLVAAHVGRQRVRDVQRDVRSSMLRQALALTGGSTQETARLLGVTRQAVSQMLQGSKGEEPV